MARGRQAEVPTEIPPKGWWDIALRIKEELSADHVGLIAAGVAFYGLFSLFPAITAMMAIAGLLVEPSQIVSQMDKFSQILPEDVSQIVIDQMTAVAGSREAGLSLTAILGIGIAFYSASKGMGSLIEGTNVAYDEKESRGFIRLKLLTFIFTFLLIFGLLVGLIMTIAIPASLQLLNLGAMIEIVATALSWLVLIIMTMVGLALIYRYAPSRDEAEWAWVSPGAIVACLLWILASAGFAIYVGNFGSYNETFGTMAGVVVLLMWFWISAYIILLGAELNAEMEAQTKVDTTVGRAEPMGARGAVKADELGKAASK